MKKLLTLLTLMLCVCSGAWAAAPSDPAISSLKAKSFTSTELLWTPPTNAASWYNAGWVVCGKSGSRNSFVSVTNKKYTINPATDETVEATACEGLGIKNNSDTKTVYFCVTNVTAVDIYVISNGSSDRTARMTITNSTNSDKITKTGTASANSSTKISADELNTDYTYLVKVDEVNGADMTLYAVRFTAPAAQAGNAPSITTQPQSATYEKGATAEALTVEATAYADGALSYQWYSNSSNSTTTGTAIEGATNNTYTPSTETVGTTYYYCIVTEADNEDVATSSVATITVNAPACAAPTFTLGSYNYENEGYEIIANCETEGATLTYKVGNGEATACTAGIPFYAKGGKLIITASKEGFSSTTNESGTQYTLNGAPSATSPEVLIPFNSSSDNGDKNITHTYKSVSIDGGVFAGINGAEGLKIRTNQNNNTLTLTVNPGYKVTGITFKARSNNKKATIDISNVAIDGTDLAGFEAVTLPESSKDLYTYNTGAIEATQNIVFTFNNSKITGDTDMKNYQIHANITVTYEEAITTTTLNLNTKGYATYSNSSDVEVSGAKAYTAYYDWNTDAIVCEEIADAKVPAGTGVLLFGEASAEVTLTPTTGVAALTAQNDLRPTTLADGTTATMKDGDTYWALSGDTFMMYTGETFVPNKAYFETTAEEIDKPLPRNIRIDFTHTTGINSLEAATTADGIYDLQGRRVAMPTKGLYILNGKKVIFK